MARKSLARMDDPYNGIIMILELVGTHQPTLEDLHKMVPEEKGAKALAVQYNRGEEDILLFCWRQLGIIKMTEGRFELTETGHHLRRDLYSPVFPGRLFRVLVQTSAERFSYFHDVYRALNRYVREGQTIIAKHDLRAFLDETNQVSKKEIKRLMIACGAIEIEDDTVRLNPQLLGTDPTEVQITQLVSSVDQMIRERGRLVYSETLKRLETLHPEINIREMEPTLRSRLWLNASRTVEYIDGIR